MESIGYCVRVQALDGYGTKISALSLDDRYTSIIAVKHKGVKQENPHYHIVVRTSVKPQAFRVRMKTIFTEGKGNEHMSIRQWDGDNKAISYLFHEDADTPLIVRKSIEDNFLEEMKQQNATIRVEVSKAKVKSSHTLYDDALEHFGKSRPSIAEVNRIPDEHIGKFMILHALRNGKYSPSGFLLRQMVIKVKFALLKGNVNAEEEYAEKLANNIFRL